MQRINLYKNLKKKKLVVNDDILPNGIKIPKGSRVGWSLYAMGRMEKYWGKDCLDFKPERWFESEKSPEAGVFAPFIMGPRQCLGKEMAYLEAKVMLSMIIPKFKFKLDPTVPEPNQVASVTLRASHMKLLVSKRK